MGSCKYCHEKAGFFKDAHEQCTVDADAALSEIKTFLSREVTEPTAGSVPLTEQISESLKRGRLSLKDAQITLLNSLDDSIFEQAMANPVSNDELERLGEIYKAVDPSWFDDPTGLVNWRGFMSVIDSNTIHEVLHQRVPYYAEELREGFRLSSDEHPVVRRNTTLAEYKSVGASISYQSVSLPIGGGMYYRLGTSQPHTRKVNLVPVDEGLMLITTRAIYFGGQAETFRIPYTSILRLESFLDGFGLHENYGRGKVFIPAKLGTEDNGWFFYNVVSALLKWEENQA